MSTHPDDSPALLTPWMETVVIAGASLVPDVGGPLSVLIGQTIALARSHVAEAGRAAVREAGDPEMLLRRIQEDERLGLAMTAVCEAASRTAMREKRIVLGRAVGRAARDSAELDHSELMISILKDLDTIHFRVLAELRDATQGRDIGQGQVESASELLGRYPSPVRAALERHGLLKTVGTYGGGMAVAGVDEFALALLDEVSRAAADDQAESS